MACLRAFDFSFAVGGLRRTWRARPVSASASMISRVAWIPGWLFLLNWLR